MEILSFTVAAGETKVFERGGTYMEVIDAAGALNIELQAADGSQADDMRGALSGFYSEEPFVSLQVGNPETYAQTVKLMISTRRGGSRRQPGNVRVIDASAEKTMAGRQFISSVLGNPDAANQSVVNVQAGGGYFALRSLTITSTSAGDVMIAKATAPGTATPGTGSMINKRAAGAGSGLVRIGAGIAAAGNLLTAGEAPGCAALMRLSLAANIPFEKRFDPPLIIEGTALIAVMGVAVNRQINAVFEGEDA